MAGTEKVDDISRITVSAGVLGKIIGVSDRRIRQLVDEGIQRYYPVVITFKRTCIVTY